MFSSLFSFFRNGLSSVTGRVVQLVGGELGAVSSDPMTYDPVFRAVDLIASSVAKLPLDVFERVGEGKEKAVGHAARRVLRYNATAEMTAFRFWQTVMGHVVLKGNGYAYIKRGSGTRIDELVLLNPDAVTPFKENGALKYLVASEAGSMILRAHEVLHLAGIGFDGILGYSVLDLAGASFARGMKAAKHIETFFENGAVPATIIEVPEGMKPEARETFLKHWNKAYRGQANAHRTAILTAGAKVTTVGISAKDSQLLELRKFETIVVANWFGIPPHKLGDASRTSYNSLEQENRAFLDDCLDKWLVMIEQECRNKLLTEEQKRNDSHVIEFNRRTLLRADTKTRFETYSVGLASEVLTQNEARAAENLNPVPGGDKPRNPNINPGSGEEEKKKVATKNAENTKKEEGEIANARDARLLSYCLGRLANRLAHEREKKTADFARVAESFRGELEVILNRDVEPDLVEFVEAFRDVDASEVDGLKREAASGKLNGYFQAG